MPPRIRNRAYSESDIQKAILDARNKKFDSIRGAAEANNVPFTTLQNRLNGANTSVISHRDEQILSYEEEKTLFKWITHLTATGFPATRQLTLGMAEEIQRERKYLSASQPQPLLPIGHKWIYRFRKRWPALKGIYTRQIDSSRFKAMNRTSISAYFDAVLDLYRRNKYLPEHIWNMDESGFNVGDSQSSQVLVNRLISTDFKQKGSRQEWITGIECISASGGVLPPLLIFKAQDTYSRWIPTGTPLDWRFSTSNSGWTSDSHGYQWLTTVFEPCSRPKEQTLRRLLIMDGHSSHITANVIGYCMRNAIDLLILPPHTSQITQPLDVGVFGPLKRALAKQTDQRLRLDSGRISKDEWVEMYVKAHNTAFTTLNIKAGFRSTGLWPISPITVYGKLPEVDVHVPAAPRTPPQQPKDLNLTLITSSPPIGVELRSANKVFNSTIEASEMPTPVKRYARKVTSLAETSIAQLATQKRTLQEQEGLLNSRKQRKTGKRVKIAGKFVFTTKEVFKSVREAEEEATAKKKKKTTKKTLTVEITSGSESPASAISEAISILSEIVLNVK